MRMLVRFPQQTKGPICEIEDSPHHCALLLSYLGDSLAELPLGNKPPQGQDPPQGQNPQKKETQASKPPQQQASKPPQQQASKPPQQQASKPPQKQVRKPSQKVSREMRSYAGRNNRRSLILLTMKDLRMNGRDKPRLVEIKQRFQALYPQESVSNLEQVVRDLANKTTQLKRSGRGRFQLTE